MTIERKTFSFEIKSMDDEGENNELYSGKFSGIASTYGNIDSGNDRIEKGAFTTVVEKANKSGKFPRALIQHNSQDIGGVFTKLEDSEKGLIVEGYFLNTAKGRDLRIEVKAGAITGLSIGYYIGDYAIENENSKNRVRVIKTIKELPEISFVTFPMNPKANILSAKSDLPNNIRDFENLLHNLGYSNKEAVLIASHGFKSIQSDSEPNQGDLDLKAFEDQLDELIFALKK